jgi:peptide/nickel transport system substrate-binding protein
MNQARKYGVKGFRFENYGKGEQKVKNRVISIGLAIALAFSVGLIGCGGGGVPEITKYNLTISSTEGGSVATPGEGTYTYDEGTVVNLVAEPEEGYQFTNWIGDMVAIADINAAITTITMSANHSIMACFEAKPIGAFLDEVVITSEPDASAATQELKEDALDVYAFGLNDPALYAEVLSDPSLASAESLVNFDEFTFNPVGPTFPGTGKLNPFSVPKFREAMNWLVDREYIAREICDGLALPRYTCLDPTGADATERYPDLIAALEAKYAHNQTKAEVVVAQEMAKLGAVLEDDRWTYNGEPVELTFLIRTEDERKQMGDYFADLLEGLGFTVARQYGTIDDLSPIARDNPAQGKWHVYTGGWVRTVVVREEGGNFGFFYTNLWSEGGPLWQAYVNDSMFYEAAKKLWNYDYTSMEERRTLFEICLPMSMEDNVRMFVVTEKRSSPMRDDVSMAVDASGGLSGGFSMYRYMGSSATLTPGGSGSWVWALTAHFIDDEGQPIVGGTLRVAMPDVLTTPWNPIAGSNLAYDEFAIRATSDRGLYTDPRNGLRWPGRIEKANVVVQAGLPATVTNTEWCSLEFMPEIQVPLDAWADWDATEQRFITVAERFPEGTTALRKSVVYYPKDIFTVPLHDGSTLSMGDFILHAILQFDRAKPESAIYDESAVADFNSFMETFKGVKFITDDPNYGLIVETYSDFWKSDSYLWWNIDAELYVRTWFPGYDQKSNELPDLYEYSSGAWHTAALGLKAEDDGVLAFSQAKANALGVEWMNFVSGPSLPILKSYLDSAKATNYIPYEPTMGQYVTQAEAAERWSNLERWYAEKGHFWVGSGPFYLESANTAEKVVHLKRFEKYPDPTDKWLFLLEPLP